MHWGRLVWWLSQPSNIALVSVLTALAQAVLTVAALAIAIIVPVLQNRRLVAFEQKAIQRSTDTLRAALFEEGQVFCEICLRVWELTKDGFVESGAIGRLSEPIIYRSSLSQIGILNPLEAKTVVPLYFVLDTFLPILRTLHKKSSRTSEKVSNLVTILGPHEAKDFYALLANALGYFFMFFHLFSPAQQEDAGKERKQRLREAQVQCSEKARELGEDAFSLSDYNTNSPLPERARQGRSAGI